MLDDNKPYPQIYLEMPSAEAGIIFFKEQMGPSNIGISVPLPTPLLVNLMQNYFQ